MTAVVAVVMGVVGLELGRGWGCWFTAGLQAGGVRLAG